jgi:serine/threonine protein kinase
MSLYTEGEFRLDDDIWSLGIILGFLAGYSEPVQKTKTDLDSKLNSHLAEFENSEIEKIFLLQWIKDNGTKGKGKLVEVLSRRREILELIGTNFSEFFPIASGCLQIIPTKRLKCSEIVCELENLREKYSWPEETLTCEDLNSILEEITQMEELQKSNHRFPEEFQDFI